MCGYEVNEVNSFEIDLFMLIEYMSSFAIYEAVAKSRQGGGLLDEGGLLSPTDNRSFRRVFEGSR